MRFLRALGRLLTALGLTFALGAASLWALARGHLTGPLVNELALGAAATAAFAFVGLRIEKRTLAALGLPRDRASQDFLRGTAIGGSILCLVVGVLALLGRYVVTSVHFVLPSIASSLVLMLAVAWFEEILFRGIVFRIVEDGAGSIVALAVSAALFGAVHATNAHSTLMAVIAIAIEAGVLLGAAFMVSRSLWLPIGLHFAWNFFEGPVFGAAVSGAKIDSIFVAETRGPAWLDGGAFGPEAGVVAVVVGSAAATAFLVVAARRHHFVPLRRANETSPRAISSERRAPEDSSR